MFKSEQNGRPPGEMFGFRSAPPRRRGIANIFKIKKKTKKTP